MKNIISIIAACILLITVKQANAQTIGDFKKMPPEQKARFIADSLRENLNLTDAQYEKIYAGALAGVQKAIQIMQGPLGRREKGKLMRALLEEEESKAKAILTADQFALYEQKRQNAIAWYKLHFMNQKLVFNAPPQ